MIDIEIVNQFVYENLSSPEVNKNGNHWTARCPLCGDSKKSIKKKRFNLDYKDGNPIYHCFNCGESGSFLSLYGLIHGIPFEEVKKHIFKYNKGAIYKKLTNKRMKKDIYQKGELFDDIFYSNSIGLHSKCDGYIERKYQSILKNFYEKRNIPKDIELRIAYNGLYRDRILIPVFEGEHVVYFQGRSIHDNNERKYLNPKASKSIILNRDKFDFDKYIIIVEGLLDAYVIGDQATTCLGSYISLKFLDEVYKHTNVGVIIAFDNDIPGKKSLINFIKENPKKNAVKYFLTPEKYNDANDINNIVEKYSLNTSQLYDIIVKNSYKLHTLKIKKWS